MEPPELDPAELLDKLRAEHQVLYWAPLPPEQVRRARETNQARSRTSLEYLHHNWALPDSYDPGDASGDLRGKFISRFGRLTFRVLGSYLREERALLSHMVRVNEALEQRCDELTLRLEQLNQDMVDRQAAEAENLAKLALWLHLDSPPSADPTEIEPLKDTAPSR